MPYVADTFAKRQNAITHPSERIFTASTSPAGEFAYAHVEDGVIGWDYEPAAVSQFDLKVFDRETGREIKGVIWCNAHAGTLRRYKRGTDGKIKMDPGTLQPATETINGNFAIVREGARD